MHNERIRVSRQENHRRADRADVSRHRRGPLHDRQALHLHQWLGEPGLQRLALYTAGRKILSDLGVTLHYLTTWWDVLAVAKASGTFDAALLAEVEKFMHDPAGWSKAHGGVAEVAD